MKLKGINPIEQHIEKIVLIVVSTIFLAVLALQFLWQPNLVKVGTAEPVPPARAYDVVEAEARRVADRMQATPEPLSVQLMNPADEFRQATQAPVAPKPRLVAMTQSVPVEGIGAAEAGLGEGTRVAAPTIPAPVTPVAASFWSTLDPAEVVASEELRKLVPAEQPFDKVAVSVEAKFDGTALLKALVDDPDGDAGPLVALPPNWWRGGLEIVAVTLEREELTPTGEWTGLTTVPAMPGSANLLAELPEEPAAEDIAAMVQDAKVLAAEIQRPAFYRTIAGASWMPPSESVAQKFSTNSPEVQRLLRDREDRTGRIERIDQELQELGAAPAGSSGGSRGGGKGAGGSSGGSGRDSEPSPQNTQKQRRLEAQRKQLEEQIKQIDQKLSDLGYLAEQPEGQDASMASSSGAAETEAKPLLENPALTVWAHDLTAEPGKTYRYRVQIGVNNPLFGKGPSLDEKHQELATMPVLLSEPSEWTQPVEALADSYFFITSASPADQLGPARASAELYRFYYGYFRRGTVTVEPGDVVEGAVKLPDPNLLPIYDLSKLTPSSQPAAPASQPVRDDRPAKGPAPANAEPTPSEQQGATPELAANAAPGPRNLTASAGMMLLDVAVSPVTLERGVSGAARQQYLAFFRGRDGQIVPKAPDEDRSPLYQRLAASAREGESQGQPAAPQEPAEREQPGPRRRPEPQPDPMTDGGGGAGGG